MVAKFEHWLVVDLEATCNNDGSLPRDETEIIEIGAVMVDAKSVVVVGEFQTFVRPVRHPELTAFCTELTSICQVDVDGAPGFPEAIEALRSWMSGFTDVLFCSWGAYDRNQIRQDCAFHGLEDPMGTHFNLKLAFAEARGLKKPVGMGKALRSVGLTLDGTHHRGIDDARNIARLLRFILVS